MPQLRARQSNFVWLLTDFGTKDSYVAEVKARILSVSPAAQIFDITHEIQPGDIRAGAIVLRNLKPSLPDGSVILAVVDPGVGTKRRRLCLEVTYGDRTVHIVAPDNGLTSLIEAETCTCWSIELSRLPQVETLSTFDGRDVFAQVAGLLTLGFSPSSFATLSEIKPEELQFPKATYSEAGIEGEVVYIDSFGNAITNLHRQNLSSIQQPEFYVDKARISLYSSYEEIPDAASGVVCSSQGYFEIAMNRRPAAPNYPLGTKIIVRDRANP